MGFIRKTKQAAGDLFSDSLKLLGARPVLIFSMVVILIVMGQIADKLSISMSSWVYEKLEWEDSHSSSPVIGILLFSVYASFVSIFLFSKTIVESRKLRLGMLIKYYFRFIFVISIYIFMITVPYAVFMQLIYYIFEENVLDVNWEFNNITTFVVSKIIWILIVFLTSPIVLRISFVLPSQVSRKPHGMWSAFKRASGHGWAMACAVGMIVIPTWLVLRVLPEALSLYGYLPTEMIHNGYLVVSSVVTALLWVYVFVVITVAYNKSVSNYLLEVWD